MVVDEVFEIDPVLVDPPLGSLLPWSTREKSFLEMSRFDLELLHNDGEDLPPRVVAKLFKIDRIMSYNDLFLMFR